MMTVWKMISNIEILEAIDSGKASRDVFVLKERSSVRVYEQTGYRVLDCGSSIYHVKIKMTYSRM